MHRFIAARRLALPTQLNLAAAGTVRPASSRPKKAPSTLRGTRKHEPPPAHSPSPHKGRSVSPLPGQFSPGDLDNVVRRIPLELFQSAYQEKLTTVSVREAAGIARGCIELAESLHSTQQRVQVLEAIQCDLDKISQVLFLLLRSPYFAPLAFWFLPQLAAQGDKRSLYYLSHIKSESSRPLPSPDDAKDPLQVVINGQTLLDNGHLEHAAQRFKQAMDLSKPVEAPHSFDALFPTKVRHPWDAYGSLMATLGKHEEAKEAYTIGATVYDHPRAYKLLLSETLKSGDFVKYEEYLTKVAMGNDVAACYQLGNLYLTLHLMHGGRGEGEPAQNKDEMLLMSRYGKDDSQQLAAEWYEIAVAGGHTRAALVMAGLLRQLNKKEEGLKYLQIAEKSSDYSELAAKLRGSWHDAQFTVDLTDLMGS
ncbi:hypothetical protein MGYG_06428 [Nannizzia gypsea CBS 118893]|uniref:Uncharacterized protein n=1 Tax=Arthroderma gypseum (strain ATCC MYA-4604 / CBS 118893) TaxID=535722 RepID=E4UZA1_ARTGP|nr:hypothetical protein MGYG_06428 [Nannizzia gypsea CBS 118893]EFR03431.1 hypothetical protein MGYG_06428 [Nannizzia gypsea CBS 118893]